MFDRLRGLMRRLARQRERERMSQEDLATVAQRVRRLRYVAGAVIVRQGDLADRFFVISEGTVEVVRERPDGADLSVATLGENEYFGEIGIVTGGPRVATVRALTAVTLLAFEAAAFRQLLARSESGRKEFDRVIRKRLEDLLDTGLG